jgi:hypothetical protein
LFVGKEAATLAFATTYDHTIRDERDDDDLSWMNEQSVNPLADLVSRPKEEDEDTGDEEEEEAEQEEDEDRFITPQQIVRQARELAKEDPGGEVRSYLIKPSSKLTKTFEG